MKKTTRTARKALSVFLCVLMMFSTWAVAVPGLASAANKYYVKVYVNIYDGSDGYGGAYSVEAATGKPANYSWATNDGWYGRINMTGFTVFGEGGDYDAQDVSAALLEAENLGTYYAMSDLSDNNANGDWDSEAIAQKVYTFTLDSFPVEVFWMNDENNWDGGNTGFAIRKLTVATSEGGTEHTMWEGLAGSDSETYNYYGSITPTGIHTCFEDYAKNYDMDDYKFYKAITTSSQRAWSDPYSAGSYGTYYLNDYASGGVSATFSEGVESIAYNVDYINTGSTDTYYMNFINHSKTQSATIVGVNNSDKFVNNPAGTVIPAGGIAHFELKNISSLGGDGGVANFCFNYTLDNVYASDALDASLAQFYQPCYVGTWNASDDSKQISDENGDGNTGFSLYKADNYTWGDNSMTIVNTFQTTEGILERNSATSGDGTDNASFNYNYYIDTSGMTNWTQTGLRFHVKESQYYTLSFQPADYTNECGTITMGGTFANPNEASITITDIAYSSVTEEFKYNHDQASGFYTYADYYTTGTPMWNVTQADNNASFYNNSEGWFRFAGNIIKGGGNSAATINFSNMTYRERQNGAKVYFSGTINVYAFDKSALSSYVRETLLDFAPMKERYNATAFSAYETALMNAMTVLANQKTTQVAVNEAYTNLKSAVEALQTNANLVNQIDSLKHIQYVSGIGSEIANQTAERYVLIPLGEHAVPEKAEYIGNGTFRDATNKKSNLVTNYTKDDTEIDYLNYYYWNIDYSQINGTIALVDEALENFDSDTYSSTLKTALENAKEQLEAIDQTTTGDNTPTSQEDVDNVIKAATDLLAHMDEGYEHCDYDANDDGEDELKTKDSTCSEAGYTYYKCNICGKIQKVADLELEDHQYIEESNGDYKIFQAEENHYNECEVCGYKLTYDHKFTYTSVDGEATHTATCSDCGYSYEEGHSYGAWTKLDDSTHQRTCSLCPATETSEHTWGAWVEVDDNTHKRTCTEDGCDASETADHAFTNPVLARPALVDGAWTDGSYTYTCACGATKTEAAERADYTELEDAVAELETLLNDENLTADAEAEINEALEKAEKLADDLVTAEQDKIDALVDELKDVKADVEKAIEESKTTSPITEATSGIGVQFLKKTGVDTVESVQLGANGGFEAVRMRLSNHNSNLPITITKVTADKAYIGADDSAASNVFDTATVIAEAGTTDLYIVAPADFATAGNITYTIEYMVGNADEGYLKGADGNPVVFTTNAFLYAKAAGYNPHHYMDEKVGVGSETSEWDFYLESTNYGDFVLVHDNKAPYDAFGNTNLVQDGAGLFDYVREQYDYENDACYAGCADGSYDDGDAHAATYRFYVDTSLAPTWEAAGLRARFVENEAGYYHNAPIKYVRLANNQTYLDKISGVDKTFSVTFLPSSSGTQGMTWTATSNGDMTVSQYNNPDQNNFLFGYHHPNEGCEETTAYANFAGAIPTATEDAKLMFSPRLEFNGPNIGFAEAVTMTTHLYITSYDKAELREAVNSAETAGYNPGYFDETKYEAYEEALANAKEVLGKAETNQTQVDEATEALNAAIDDLTKAENEAKFVLTVTHSIHENADKNSTATGTEYDYYLVNGTVTPALNAAAIALDTINKYDNTVTLNVTADTAHTYNYWFIDYTGVKDAIDAADAIINDTTTGYSDEYKQKAEDAKKDLQDILDGKDATTTPESQKDVTDAIDAVAALTGHTCDKAVEIPAKAPTCEEDGLTAGAKCSVCGKITVAQETDPATDHNYDIANATLIARPELVDGTWTTGTYEATCLNDESHKLPLEGVQRADYTAFDEAIAKLKELATYENFTDEVKAGILNLATQLENGTYDPDGDGTPNVLLNYVADYTYNGVTIEGEQDLLDQVAAELNSIVAQVEDNKDDPNFIKPDYTDIIAEWEEYLSLVEQYGGEVEYGTEGDSLTATVTNDGYIKDATAEFVNGGFEDIMEIMNDPSANKAENQDFINGAKEQISAINEGIVDGTLRDPNFEAYDAEVKKYNDETSEVNVSAEDAQAVADAMAIVDAIKANPDATAKDSDATIAEQTAVIKGINDKYAPCVAGTHDYADATCTDAKTCKLCGATTGIANGHDWSEWELTLAPTTDAEGTYTRTCSKGDATETKAVAREDYTDYDAAVERAEDMLESDKLTDAAKDEIREALEKAEELNQNLPADVIEDGETVIDNDSAEKITDATDALTEVLDKIANDTIGTYEKVDYTAYDAAVDAYEALNSVMTAEDKAAVEAIKAEIAEIPADGSKADYQTQVDKAAADIAAINAKYGDCADGNHTWGEPVLTTAPTADAQGEYTETCGTCGATQITKVDLADYDAFNDAVKALEELAKTEGLTDEAKAAINAALAKAEALDKNLPADVTTVDGKEIEGGQDTIDALVAELNGVVADVTDDIADGSALEPDYEAWEEAETAYDALDKTNVKSEIIAEADALKATIAGKQADDTLTQATATQAEINAATTRLNEIIAGINDGTATAPDYTEWDAAEGEYNALDKTNAPAELVTEATNLKAAIDALKADETANAAEDQQTINAATARLNEIIDAINDVLTEKPDFSGYDASHDAYEELVEQYGDKIKDSVTNDVAALDAIVDGVRNDEGATKVEDQDTIDDAKTALDAIIAGINDGSLIKDADFTEADKDLADAKNKAEKNDVIDSVKKDIENIEDALDELRNDPATNANDQDAIDALERELEKIIAGINDGSLVKPDYTDAETAIENAENTGSLTDADKEALDDLKEALEEIRKDPTSNKKDDQTAVDEIKDAVQDIVDKYADCENGNHNWGAPVLTTAPTADAQGEYTETCGTCGATQITKVDLADYEAFDDAVEALEALLGTENLTDEAKTAIEDALADAEGLDKNLPADATTADGKVIEGGQDEIDALVAELEKVVAETNAGIEDGSLVKPDYTEVDKDLADAKDKAENNDVIDSVKKDIEDIEDKLNDLKEDPATNKAEHQDDVDALEKQLEDIIAGIEDGSLVKPDYTDAETAIENAENTGSLTDADKEALEELKDKLDEIKNDPASNKKDDQTAVDEIKNSVQDIINKYADCENGNHDYETTTVAPTCTEKGYDIYTCKVCSHSYKGNYVLEKGHSEVILEAVEPTCSSTGLTEGVKCAECNAIIVAQNTVPALRHTDEDADGTCDVCGKGGLYDGCTCLCHNTHWFWRLVYIIFRIIWRVFKIHQVCPCGAVHY